MVDRRDVIADALLDYEHSIVPYPSDDSRASHRPAQLRRADAILTALDQDNDRKGSHDA